MRFVIDGYNLMHALGMAPKPGITTLERARLRFVEWLAIELGKRSSNVLLVFDSLRSTGGGEQVHRGVRLLFANARTADDVIEEMVEAEKVPSRLAVVSNDHRLQAAAIRRGCMKWTCGEFVDWLQAKAPTALGADRVEKEEKPSAASDAEIDEWLRRFDA